MSCARSAIIAVLVSHAITAGAVGGERSAPRHGPIVASAAKKLGRPANDDRRVSASTSLDRVAFAVDAAESIRGEDVAMWRVDPSGPQGPMQVSEAAATDVGGGDRFDSMQNRAIGRAYLAQLHGRYGNWPDAIAAYNWGIGKMDAWVKAGRPADKFLTGVAVYLRRVLHESGLCDDRETMRVRQPSSTALPSTRYAREIPTEIAVAGIPFRLPPEAAGDPFVRAVCSDLDAGGGAFNPGDLRPFAVASPFHRKLDQAMQLALQHLTGSR